MGAIVCLPPKPALANQSGDDATKKSLAAATAASQASEPPGTQPKDEAKPTPIGFVALIATEATMIHHRRSEVGITITDEYRGQGYGSEAILWALQWGFRRANLHRIGISAFAWNERAWRLYERVCHPFASSAKSLALCSAWLSMLAGLFFNRADVCPLQLGFVHEGRQRDFWYFGECDSQSGAA